MLGTAIFNITPMIATATRSSIRVHPREAERGLLATGGSPGAAGHARGPQPLTGLLGICCASYES